MTCLQVSTSSSLNIFFFRVENLSGKAACSSPGVRVVKIAAIDPSSLGLRLVETAVARCRDNRGGVRRAQRARENMLKDGKKVGPHTLEKIATLYSSLQTFPVVLSDEIVVQGLKVVPWSLRR